MKRIASLDVETTGLDFDRHRVWEIGIITPEGVKMHYHVPPTNFVLADATALNIGGFYERFTFPEEPNVHDMRSVLPMGEHEFSKVNIVEACLDIAKALADCTILAANPEFDARMLSIFLREHGVAPAWSHRYLNLGSFCAGAWGVDFPLSTKTIAERIPNPAAHTALGDAEWNLKVYRTITGGQVG